MKRIAVALLIALVAASPRAGSAASWAPGELLVKLRPGARTAGMAAIESAVPLAPMEALPLAGIERLRITDGTPVETALARLRAQPLVAWAEPNYEIRATAIPNDSLFGRM